jgi:hypothetical protein
MQAATSSLTGDCFMQQHHHLLVIAPGKRLMLAMQM